MSIDRRITQLRSRLRHASDEFRNLVAEDLVDMKWKTFLLLVQGLFPLVPTLRDACEELGMIQQRRSKEAALERTAGLGRDERIASEQAFRYSVCECVLRGLEVLRWPPAMQAFSNPLQEIIDDKSVKLSVVEFILSCVPGSRSHHVEGPPSARRAPATREEEEESGGPPEEVLRMNAPMPMHTEESHNISARSSSSQRSKRTLRSFPDDASASAAAAAASISSPRGDARGQAEGPLSPRAARPAEDLRGSFGSEEGFGGVPDFDSISQVSVGRSAAASISGVVASGGQHEDFATLRRSIQVLQHQNLELTMRLRSTLVSMRARDELENQMDTIIHDVRSSLAELSGIGSSVSHAHTTTTTDGRRGDGGALKPRKTARGQDAGVSTIEEDKVIDSILNDSESSSIAALGGTGGVAANRAPRSSTKPSAKDGALEDKSGESKQMWRFVSAQVDGLYRRWTEARGAVRDCMLAEVNLHPDTVRNFMREKGAPSNASSSRRSPESRSTSSSRAAPASRSSRPATQQEFTTDFSLDSMSLSSYGATNNKRPVRSQSHNYNESSLSLGSTPSQLRVHQLLGLCPPNSSSDSKDMPSSSSGIELDSHRVAQLQRDFVDFSRQAFLMINAIDLSESADDIESLGRRPQKQQGKNGRSDTKEHLSALRAASQRLLLHTSCYAPLAPLDVPFPMSNDLSGLEALIDEVRGKGGRGSPPEVMERLIERAQAEQEALVRALGYAEVHARASMQKDKVFHEKVRSFSSSMKRSLDEFSRDMKALQAEVIRPLLSSIVAAERARLNIEGLSLPTTERKRSSASHSSAPVNPLDVLARGYMGGEVSALVNSLRAFGPGVQHLDKSLEDISLLVGSHIPSQLSSLCQQSN